MPVLGMTTALLTLEACVGERASDQGVPWAEHDSAGIVVVQNEDRPDLDDAGFMLGTEPLVSIGSLDGAPEYQFFRVAGGTVLEDGRIAIVNAGSQEIRLYGMDGDYLYSFGGEGEGPGEFGKPVLLGMLSTDSLLVYDSNLRRASVVHVDEGYVRAYTIGAEGGGFPVPQGMFADGTQMYGGGLFFSDDDGGFPSGVVRNPSAYHTIDRTGGAAVDFGEYPGFELYAKTLEGGGFMARSLPFGRNTSSATAGDRFFVGIGGSYEISVFDQSATLLRLIRLDRPIEPITQADIDRYIEDEIEDADTSNERRQFEALMAEMPIPTEMPPYSAFVVDALGYLWVQDYAGPRVREPSWTIFDREGHIVDRISTPDRMQVLEIGEDYLLGRLSDEFDVEYIQIYELTRPFHG